jgi:hypothetical protein
MITKRQAIELVQHRLTGGDIPEDVRRLYPRSIIARIINFALSDIVTRDPYAASDMAVPYSFDVKSDERGYYVEMNPQPMSGSFSIYTVEDQSEAASEYLVQTKAESSAMKVLRGANKSAAVLYKNLLRFNKKPTGSVTITMIPNIYQMEDDDILVIPSDVNGAGELAFFQMCLQALSSQGFQDDLNNNSIDIQALSKG